MPQLRFIYIYTVVFFENEEILNIAIILAFSLRLRKVILLLIYSI